MEAMNGTIEPHAIQTRPGPSGTVLEYLPHGYVTDQLNKVFGPFWSFWAVDVKPGQKYDIVEYDVERQNRRTGVTETLHVREVVVMCELRVRIYNLDGSILSEEKRPGSGGKIWEKNISFTDTLQSAESEALKRAAFRLGRKFGLQLYYDDEERRAVFEEKNTPRIPTTIAQLYTAMQQMNISDELFEQKVGYPLGQVDPADGRAMPKQQDIPAVWQALTGGSNGSQG